MHKKVKKHIRKGKNKATVVKSHSRSFLKKRSSITSPAVKEMFKSALQNATIGSEIKKETIVK